MGGSGSVLDAGKEEGSGEESESGREEKAVSFGERLRAGKDREDEGEDEEEQKRLNLTEQEGACLVVFGCSSCVGFGRLTG